MKIKKRKIETKQERKMLIGLITNETFIAEIKPIYNQEFISSPYIKTIVKWVFDYYDKYEKAPGQFIQDIYTSKLRAGEIIEDQEELIENFLSKLSEEYVDEKFDVFFNIDETEKYFRTKKTEIITDQTKYYLNEGDIDKAELTISGFTKVKRVGGSGVDVYNDIHLINETINYERSEMFKLTGVLGEVVGIFERGDLIAVAAPPKRGKTWWLLEAGLTATWQRHNVLFISLEMIERQLLRRIYQRVTGEPKKECVIKFPYFDKNGEVDFKDIKKQGINSTTIKKKLNHLKFMMRGKNFKIKCYPSYSANVEDIYLDLHNLETYEDFKPDVIVVDYADILAPENDAPKDYRHRLDQTWKMLRGLAQHINGLVITATQTTRATFKKDVDQGDVAEDMRKLAHVAAMVSINQNEEDKNKSAVRVKVMVNRHEDFNINQDVLVLQHLGIGAPILGSKILKKTKEK